MLQARLAPLPVPAHEEDPARLDTAGPPQLLAHPHRAHLSSPVIPFGRWPMDHLGELCQLLGDSIRLELWQLGALLVMHVLWSLCVTATGKSADLVARIACALCNLKGHLPFGQ